MKNKFLIAASFSAFLLIAPNVKAANFKDNQIVDANKTWTIRFTSDVGFDDLTKKGITVTDSKGNVVSVGIQQGRDNKTIIVTAPQGGYTVGENYTLNIGSNAHSLKGKKLKNKYVIHFNVKGEPSVKEVICTDEDEIRIRFDRPMDTKTAANPKYYQINDKNIDGAKIEFVENNTVVKITNLPDGILDVGTNVLLITNDVKDAFGNKMDENKRLCFDKAKDETKPTISSSTIIDDTTLRVRFSEDVKYAYATNIYNYELKDANNVDIMSKSGVYIRAAADADEKVKSDTDVYDIKLDKTVETSTSTYKFNSSKYTLTVKNIIDKADEPNKMEPQTINIDKSIDTSLDVQASFKSNKEVAINFGKEMDLASISNTLNYYYVNGDGDSKNLPKGVDITVSSDNESVVLDFSDTNNIVNPFATSGDNIVKKVSIRDVEDAEGNKFHPGALKIASTSTNGPKLEENTFKLFRDGDDVKAEFLLDHALDTVNCEDFKISGITADDVDLDKEKVTLTFREGSKADAVLALGSEAMLQISPSSTDPSEDLGGRIIAPAAEKVYYNKIAPETDRDNYSATVTVDGTGKVTGAYVYITLKTPVDTDMLAAYKDDFLFVNETKGTTLDAKSVKLNKVGGRTALVFTLKDAATKVADGDKIGIFANSDKDDINLMSQEDRNGKNVLFVPTIDDLKVKTVKVIKATAAIEN